MKRCWLLCIAVLALSGCSEKENNCGNGMLDADEVCDGQLFAQNIVLNCENGVAGDISRLKCTDSCNLDIVDACTAQCGNGRIEPGEECDGLSLPIVNASCDHPDFSKLSCVSCRLLDAGVCGFASQSSQIVETCGNSQLDDQELCDGEAIRESAKICPENMVLRDASKFKCFSSCRLVDISEACKPFLATCGNGKLDVDKGEWCDGDLFADVEFEPCPAGMTRDEKEIFCTDACEIDSSRLCVSDNNILLSEVVPVLEDVGDYQVISGLALEFANMSHKDFDLSACSIDIYKADGTQVKTYDLSSLVSEKLAVGSTFVVCSQEEDHFDGICQAEITEDLIQRNISDAGYLALVCGGEYIDILNLNSFIAAINKDAVDFVRRCGQEPVTEPASAMLGDAWNITALTDGAPRYGLGEHCPAMNFAVESCTYTIDRHELTDRSQVVNESMEIKIPGLTTRSEKTDVSPSLVMRFVVGKLSESRKASQMSIHLVTAKPDKEWTNSEGVDRYTGVLYNFDTYVGFLNGEEGSYVFDAAISFDGEETWTYCGPKGIVKDYAAYKDDDRNLVEVSYQPSTCGDNRIEGGEVCDGDFYMESSLVCDTASQVVTNRSKLVCYGCNWVETRNACSKPIATCGDNHVDEDTLEICDGTDIPESAKTCPANMILKENPEFVCSSTCSGIDAAKACEPKCGNGKLESDEICDGTLFDQDRLADEAKCERNDAVFDEQRLACNRCQLDKAVCVPNRKLVVDEYLVKTDGLGNPEAIALSINNYSADIDLSLCSLSLIDPDGTNLMYYSLSELAGERGDTLGKCQPLKICSEPMDSAESYKQVFGDCDATLDQNVLVASMDSIGTLQLTCDGYFVDYFDFAGLVSEAQKGNIHGKLKAADTKPWIDRQTVKLSNRMDLDKSFNLDGFAKPVCE